MLDTDTAGHCEEQGAEQPSPVETWEEALAHYDRVRSVHSALWGLSDAAQEAVEATTPDRIDHYFDVYGLGIGLSKPRIEEALKHYVWRTGNQLDVAKVASDFDAYQTLFIAARERFETDRLYRQASDHNATFSAVRDRLMAIPAPDTAALLLKIETAAVSLDEEHADSVLADARRLLASEAAE